MAYFFRVFVFLILIVTVCGISACGKVSDAVPYEDSGYPHSYPRR